MKQVSILLIVDACINYALGLLCLMYSIAEPAVGAPIVESAFYPNILGAVFFGIGTALTIECFRRQVK